MRNDGATPAPAADRPLPTVAATHREVHRLIAACGRVMLDQQQPVQRIVCALLARGHVLLEDVPGVGKTTLAKTVATAIGAAFRRIQFTADLLPSDITGVQVLGPGGAGLAFRRGPIFAEFVLADEINRASPKAQSAMLEAMAERMVSIDDESYVLPPTFTVLATQNPSEHHGVYPLPESQLDRFLLRTELGYPGEPAEVELLRAPLAPGAALAALTPQVTPPELMVWQQVADGIELSPDVARYTVQLAERSRHHPMVRLGLSPRATLAMAQASRAFALLAGREYVVPGDIQALARPVWLHRLTLAQGAQGRAIVDDLLSDVAVPR